MRHEYRGSNRSQRRIYGKTQLDHLARYREISCDDGAILLRLNRSALRRLDFLVQEGLKTVLHADQVETGGILIGEVSPDRSVVTLLDVVAVESEYRFGPAYRPSEADLGTFAEAIAKYSSGSRSVIGYFRSHLQATVSSRAEDENLIKRFFAQGGCSIILVHAYQAEKSIGWFCQWDGGENVRLLNRFPLNTAVLPAEPPRPRPEPVLARRPEAEAEAAPAAAKLERQTDGPSPLERKSFPVPASFAHLGPWFRKASIATAAVIALLAIFALGRLSAPPRSAPMNDPRLELTVAVHDSIAEVKWNQASPVVRDSERGALDIVDGTGVHRIDLNQAQLLSGHYEYFPNQPDFTCLMTVFRNNNAFVGATQYVHLNLPQNVTPASLAERPIDRRPAPPGLPIVKSSSAQRVEDVTSGVKNSPVDPDQEQVDAGTPARPRGASFTPPPGIDRPAPAPRVEDPPELRTSGPSSGVSPLPVPRLPSGIAPPAPPATVASPPATPVSPPTEFSEPVPVTRVRPALPHGSTLPIRRDVSIRVTIQIDRQGRVTGVSPVDANDLIERLLAPYALQAARLWRFNPARRDGVPIASETVVVFQFAKNL